MSDVESRAVRVFLVVAAGVACAGVLWGREAGGSGGGGEWQYRLLPEASLGSFNLRFRVDPQTASRVRLLFGRTGPEEGFFVELGLEGVFAGRISGGRAWRRIRANRRPLDELKGTALVFERRRHRWGLIADGRLLAGGDDPPEAGEGIWFGVAEGFVRIHEVRFQAIPDVLFTDSFMRTPEDPTSWTELSGTWSLKALRNPLLSANAFFYRGSGVPRPEARSGGEGGEGAEAPGKVADKLIGACVVGDWFWSDIGVRVACRPAARGAVGLYLCYRGPTDHYLFRWSSRDSGAPVKQLIRREGGSERVLAEAAGGYTADQWYMIRAEVGSGWARLGLDDATAFLVRDEGLTCGQIGLHVEGRNAAIFDDVRVESRPATLVDFGRYQLNRWLATGGEWYQVAPAAWDVEAWPGGVAIGAARAAKLLWGGPAWRDYSVSARLGAWERGTLGLCFRYQDERNYYSVRWRKASDPVIQICRTEMGRETVLAETPTMEDGRAHRLVVRSEGGSITASVDGRAVLGTADYGFTQGRVGLFADGVQGGSFSEVGYRFLPGREPMPHLHKVFGAEQSMLVWSAALSDWAPATYTEKGKEPLKVWWHRADFYGDARIDMRLAKPPGPGGEVALVLNGNGRNLSEGLRGRVYCEAGAEGAEQALRAELAFNGAVVASARLAWKAGPLLLSVRRVGEAVVLCADERALLTFHCPAEALDRRLGWYAYRVNRTIEDVDIFSDNVINYAFNTAPTDWRVGSGIWEVTNKWQCDPRWSFFSGRSEGAAVLWNKRPLRGDFTIEYFIGNRMDRQRGRRYEYAKDMNITVCADGKDLTSGYSFLFGGFDNTVTCVFRKGERWRLPPRGKEVLINRPGLHRKWYHIAISRRGSRLAMRIDDKLVLSARDDAMPAGGHWALWTWNNGIMVARVRVSAEGIGRRDSPDVEWPATTQAIYAEK